MNRWLAALPILALVVAAACASGPSADALARNISPSTTTTSEPLPEGIQLIKISNGSFQPANLTLDTAEMPIVRWQNLDDVEYTIIARGREFESPPLPQGGSWEFDFSALEPGVYRYFTTRGAQNIPGLVDTRPAQ
jgi:plastocyanin